MNVIAAAKAFQDRGGVTPSLNHLLAKFSPAVRAAICACLRKRRDVDPVAREDWPDILGKSQLEWTGFTMATSRLKLRAAVSSPPRPSLLHRSKRLYWVFAGETDAEFPDRPLSCHLSLALAAEMVLALYGEVCVL